VLADPPHPAVIAPDLPISARLRRQGVGYSALSMRHAGSIYFRNRYFHQRIRRIDSVITLRNSTAGRAQFFACVESANCGKLVAFLTNGASRT
jgi:hypothetical protein